MLYQVKFCPLTKISLIFAFVLLQKVWRLDAIGLALIEKTLNSAFSLSHKVVLYATKYFLFSCTWESEAITLPFSS